MIRSKQIGLTLLIASALFSSHASLAFGRPLDTVNANTNGAGFGNMEQLGASGSTPGFVIDRPINNRPLPADARTFSTMNVRTLNTATDQDRADWGWLGLLGLIGLAGLRSRKEAR